ncbi:hypothetical protein ACIP98_41765 [Streptomyces sp. NPDC088354]|uniref:hypothetical protein n=1 Tax=Streptomyces sp. NPDC088354 TaxID=3365856 RepID=UPI00382E4A8C
MVGSKADCAEIACVPRVPVFVTSALRSSWATPSSATGTSISSYPDRSTNPFGASYLYQFYGTDSDSNLTGAGTSGLDKKIHAAASIPDPGRQTAQANAIERKEPAQYANLPRFSGPSIDAAKMGLTNVGATTFGTPLPEAVSQQK